VCVCVCVYNDITTTVCTYNNIIRINVIYTFVYIYLYIYRAVEFCKVDAD